MNKTEKIPVRIVQTQDMHGTKKISIMIDVGNYLETGGNPEIKLNKFKKLYFDTVNSAKKLFYGTTGEEKKYQDLPSSLYWSLGDLLSKFNEKIENEFEITNYTEAISRDFGLSKDYIYDLLTVVKFFKKSEVLDSVYFSYYRALKRKRKELSKLGLFEKEKKRLNKLGKEDKLPGREQYKKELIEIIQKNSKK
ncbi:MAG: hypothetical protein IS860_04155 [Nitrosopumilus sp.]|nr:hypothetical protein [Nitrosopumilus sp.]